MQSREMQEKARKDKPDVIIPESQNPMPVYTCNGLYTGLFFLPRRLRS